MTKKLVLSTTKSIHPPIEVEIDGKTYQNRPLSRTTFDEVKKYEKAAVGGEIKALYKQVEILFGVPAEILNNIDIRDVASLLDHAMSQIFEARKGTSEEQAEKNESKPGQGSSALSPANSRANSQ